MDFTGDLETHFTVDSQQICRTDELRQFAAGHGLKCLLIILDRGREVTQPMLTRRARGTLSLELEIADEMCRQLARAGFLVTRIKIEAAPSNRGVPQTDADAIHSASGQYFEHHLKLLLSPDQDLAGLTRLAEVHLARMSRNALRQRSDGLQERFVTQRCWGIGRNTAQRKLEALIADLRQGGWKIMETEAEFVVHDTNLEIDAGWIIAGGLQA